MKVLGFIMQFSYSVFAVTSVELNAGCDLQNVTFAYSFTHVVKESELCQLVVKSKDQNDLQKWKCQGT
jgi:hypothetical protein